MRSIRSEAPYLPSNVEFVAKNNGELPEYIHLSMMAARWFVVF